MESNEIKILVIDDVQAVRIQIRQLLDSAGFKNVKLAEDGIAAQKILGEDYFDLIICDWRMTPVNGMDLLKFVRTHSIHFDTPFIMLTAEDTKEKVIEAIASGIDDFLIKPLTIEKLNTRIVGLLRKKEGLNMKKSSSSKGSADKINEFVSELNGFAKTAEETLKKIELDLEKNKNLFMIFYERMFAIRGTAQQLQLPHITRIAQLGEEISIKATTAQSRPQIRRCVSSLWDALTTIKYLLEHHTEETTEEQEILIHRMEDTLRVLGGSREKVNMDEIDAILKNRNKS